MKIFLDIDGVMVHAISHKLVEIAKDGFYKFIPEAVRALNAIITTDDEIILTTSHRFKYSIDEWDQIFRSRSILFKNIVIMDKFEGLNRAEEIASWVYENKISYHEFLIIDDDKSLNGLNGLLKDRVILTNPYVGLTN